MARLDELFLPPPPANVLQWQVSAQASDASLIEALETIIATAEQNILTVGPDPALAPVRAELGKIVDAIAASDGRGEAVDTDELLAVAWVLISRGIAAPPPNRAAAPPKRLAELANVVALAHADPRAPILVVGVTGNTALVDLRFTEFHANAVDRLAVHDDPVRQADGSVHVNDPVVAPPAAFSRRDREKADVDTAAVALFGDGVPDSLRSVARTITKAAFPAMTGRHTWLAGHEVQSEDRTTLITISKELIMSFPAGRAALQEYCELHHFNPVACTTILTDLGHRTQQGQKRKRNASTSSDYEERDRLRASWSVVVPEPVTQRNPEYEAFSASYAPTPAK